MIQSGKFGKLNKPIRFPEFLNLTPYMRGGSDKAVYRLYGVVVHLDIMNAAFSGHYVSYVRNAQNKWYKTDDSMVCFILSHTDLNLGMLLCTELLYALFAALFSLASLFVHFACDFILQFSGTLYTVVL